MGISWNIWESHRKTLDRIDWYEAIMFIDSYGLVEASSKLVLL